MDSNPTLFQLIRDYLHLTLAYGWILIPGVLMALPEIYKWFHPAGRQLNIPTWVRWTAALVCISIAQFLAYRNNALNLAHVIEDKRLFSVENNSLRSQLDGKTQQLNDALSKLSACAKRTQAATKTYSVQNPTGSIVNQDSQNYGSQSVYNTPPARQVPADKESDFKAALETAPGSGFGIVEAGTSDDIGPLENQISRLAYAAGWKQDHAQVTAMGEGPPPIDGLQCYLSRGWNTPAGRAFKAALQVANLKCKYFDSAYSFGGVTLYGGDPTLVVGRNTGP